MLLRILIRIIMVMVIMGIVGMMGIMGGCKKRKDMIRVITVSYTHLDGDKRQINIIDNIIQQHINTQCNNLPIFMLKLYTIGNYIEIYWIYIDKCIIIWL